MIVIRLDGAPMGKERPRFNRALGRAFTPERTVRFEDRLALAAQEAMAGRPLLDGPLKVEIVALMPISASWPKKRQAAARAGTERPTKKPDWDNFGKILDALNLRVWTDDAQVVDGTVFKFYSDRPRLMVRVSAAPAAVVPGWAEGENDGRDQQRTVRGVSGVENAAGDQSVPVSDMPAAGDVFG